MTGRRPAGFAPAKINLALHVLGRRADGYHDLESLIAFADVGDRVGIEPASADRLALAGPFAEALAAACPPGDNLVMRAAAAFRAVHRGPPHIVKLEKVLPPAAGIGGGSADAAAVLRLLAAEAGVPCDDEGMAALARDLGSDVPACLFGRPCFVTGTGGAVAPLEALAEVPMVLVNAGTPVPTGPVFARWSGGAAPPPLDPGAVAKAGDAAALARALDETRNMLEPGAIALVPEIGAVLACLRRSDACLMARMSGSGGTCFGLFAETRQAAAAAARIAGENPGWWAVPTRLLGAGGPPAG